MAVERSTVVRVVSTLVVVALVAPFVVYAVPGVVGAEESYIVLTGSMRPAIDPGDVVVVDGVPPSAIERGDVITFTRGGEQTTTHRVVDVVESNGGVAFVTKGDANEEADAGVVPATAVVGRVLVVVPVVGHLITAADTQYGFVALVALPLGLLAVDLLVGLLRRRRESGADLLPVPYDPDVAAEIEAVYALKAERRAAAATAPDGDVRAAARDLSVSTGVTGLLAVYAGWNAYWQFTTLGAPRPETMSVLSGALVGAAFLVYLQTVEATDGDAPPAATAPRATPGAVEREEVGNAD
jgi:signal peptidase